MNYIKNDGQRSDADLRNEILEEVWNNLSKMKPDITSSITEEVMRKMESRYANQLGKLERRMEKRISELEKRISELERRANDAQKAPVQRRAPAGSSGVTKKLDAMKLFRLSAEFHFDGWIYYPNKDMGDFLYRVREDGSENTQLTDYSVEHVDKVEGGYLYYKDKNYNEKKFKLN